PVVTSFEVKLVGFSTVGVALGQLFLFCPGQLQPQLLRNLVRDLVLDDKNVTGFAVVLRSPKLRTRGNIDQFGANAQRAAALHDPSGENAAHIEFAPNSLSVDVP